MTNKQKKYDEIIENAHRLVVGESYTYKQLCEILETKYTTNANSKKAQLKMLDSVVEFEKISRSYKIISFRNEVRKIIDKRGGSRNYRGKSKEELTNTLLAFAVISAERDNLFKDNKDDFTITTSRHDMMCNIGMRNKHNSYVASIQPNHFCNELNLNRSMFNYVTQKIKSNSYDSFKRVLDGIVKTGLAIKTDVMHITKYKKIYDTETKEYYYDRNIIEYKGLSSEEERIKIIHIKREILTQLGYKNESMLLSEYDNDKKAVFYDLIHDKIKNDLGISEFYPMIQLHMKKSNIDNYLKKFSDISLNELVEISNRAYLQQNKTTLKRSKTKYMNGIQQSNPLSYVQAFEEYEHDSNLIADYLISIFSEPIEMRFKDLQIDHLTGRFIEQR